MSESASSAPTRAAGVELLLRLPGVTSGPLVGAALHRLHQAMAVGHTCLPLAQLATELTCSADELAAALQDSQLVGAPDDHRPVVLVDGVLASRRYQRYETALATSLLQRFADLTPLDPLQADPELASDIATLWPANPAALVDGVDWQRLACCVALAHRGAVITGGPGTGKTTVAGTIIALLSRHLQRTAERAATVFIAAPTGKAAQRLRESLIDTGRRLVAQQVLTQTTLDELTGRVATLHRLLHDRQLVDADLVVVDEVSMADVATLARVVDRLPADARLLLLGDPQQLASVEAGHVLGALAVHRRPAVAERVAAWYADCGGAGEPVTAMPDLPGLAAAQVALCKNWRSAASPAVARLAAAVREDPAQVPAVLDDPTLAPHAGTSHTSGERRIPIFVERCAIPARTELQNRLLDFWLPWAEAIVAADQPAAALAEHARRRPLCARRQGPLGVAWFNELIETTLEQHGRIRRAADGHYPGRPLLVTRNNYDQQVYNGDIGVVVEAQETTLVAFPDAGGGLRRIPAHLLDSVEPVWAMSIHKSQGSQFEHVDVLTATDDGGPLAQLLSRELIYTAITRAAYSVRLWADADLLQRALGRTTERFTGLGRLLREADDKAD